MELLDELYSGVPSVGSVDIQASFGASYALTASVLLLVPGLVAFLVEPVLFVLADYYPRKWFVCGGLFAMAFAAFAAAAAPSAIVLAGATAVAFVGTGSAVALSQATLVDAHPLERERVLTRWALLGEVGDLLAPILMAALAVFALSWRAAYVVVGALVLAWALLLAYRPFPHGGDSLPPDIGKKQTNAHSAGEDRGSDSAEDETEPGVFAALLTALGNKRLLYWLGASALCDLLDEIVIVFAALYLREHLHAGPIARSIIIGAAVIGSLTGAIIAERLLVRMPPLRLLFAWSVSCALLYIAWLLAPSVWLSTPLFFLVGMTAAPMYPIASAQAYAALPGRSGTVNAAGHVFQPLMLAIPWLLGFIADHAGVHIALALLLVQPLGLALLALYAMRPR